MSEIIDLPFFAGVDSNEQPVFESLRLEWLDVQSQKARLLRSPLLTRNLASGDHIKVINAATAEYELLQRSGNLCIRVFALDSIAELTEELVPAVEKLGGALDLTTPRALVFSIHFSIGFQQIENLLGRYCGKYTDAIWYYGNVYDVEDGSTPLRWWEDMDSNPPTAS